MDLHKESTAQAIAALPWNADTQRHYSEGPGRRAPRTPRQSSAEYRALQAFEDAQRPVRVGLSDVHTSPRYWAECSERGAYIAVRQRGVRQSKPPDARRGRVATFSRRSRSRLMQRCAQVDRDEQRSALFVTLTYPALWSRDARSWKRHLDTFWKRVVRLFPKVSAIWKLEFQRRGAPHFHLLIYGQRFMPAAWLALQWYLAVDSGDPKHFAAGTEVRRVESYRTAVSYAAKYLGKVIDEGEGDAYFGRFWGVLGRKSFPYAIDQWRLDKSGASRLVRVLRGLARSRGYRAADALRYARWSVCRGDRARAVIAWAADP